jgi:BolA family transcriptional regulator, general stress-responsive regulator
MSKILWHLEEKIKTLLHPTHLEILDESSKHFSHSGTLESHFDITIVSIIFDGMSRVHRHRCVHELFECELKGPIHALSLHLFTPEEYAKKP